MNSSKVLGGEDEYSSSESGWTMYIDSIHENDDPDDHKQGDDYHNDNYNNKNNNDDDDDDDDHHQSDDSMASDASSGRSYQLPSESSKQSHGISYFKQAAIYSSKQKRNQLVKKREERRTEAGKEESALKAKSAASQNVQSGAKVRKTNKMGK